MVGFPATPESAVGHDEVIKMHYMIGFGPMGESEPTTIMAWTTSFYVGICLSQIKWGFFNTASAGDLESSYIEFTLHDISGTSLSNFLEVRSGKNSIFFRGPMSDGFLWPGQWVCYHPIPEKFQLEFSATQGFTYTIAGVPVATTTKTPYIAVHNKITVDGLDFGHNLHGNTFQDYLDEITWKWNNSIDEPEKKATAQIKLKIDGGNGSLAGTTPFITERDGDGHVLNTAGSPITRIQAYDLKPGTPISEALQGLWQERFVPVESTPGKDLNKGSVLEVNFEKYDGTTNHVYVRLLKKDEDDKAEPLPLPVCIGSDTNCIGMPWRAQLVGLDLSVIIKHMAAGKFANNNETSQSEVQISGGNTQTTTPAEKTNEAPDKQSKETTANIPYMVGTPTSNNPTFGGWGELQTLLNNFKTSEFSLEAEMPYSFGFSPKSVGGFLKDSKEGTSNGGIDVSQGVFLQFYWYVDPHCSILALVDAISTVYRLTTVTHTIGLSGNTTQIKLSHMNVSI